MAPTSSSPPPMVNALTSSFNERIRPLLDAVDRLRELKVMQEGIELPTIVVVGDQSSGKSSVLESLAGISLPRGHGICTRVPLIMRLQDDPSLSTPLLHLEYQEKRIECSEQDITSAIEIATSEIAGNGKGISDTPLTLVVRKKGVPDLTMVDLPGIIQVPVHGQPENIYEQVCNIILKYIKPAESIILNVLSASVDFPTCGSIRMSQQVDRTGERTLAVVTKADRSPEDLLEKVTSNDIQIGLGYVCVRNRIGSESYEDARAAEAELFDSHHLLSRIDKSMVGIPVLVQKLRNIQEQSIARCLPNILNKINEKLSANASELERMPQNLLSAADSTRLFMQIINRAKETLKNLLIKGDFEDHPNEYTMHGTARLAEILDVYAKDMLGEMPSKGAFLMEEIAILSEARCIRLPNFTPRSAFLTLFQSKVKEISCLPHNFISMGWSYVENVVLRVLDEAADNYPTLQSSTARAAQNIIQELRRKAHHDVSEIIAMEMFTDYTCNPYHNEVWVELMSQEQVFLDAIREGSGSSKIFIAGLGEVEVSHLNGETNAGLIKQCFEIKTKLISYWKFVAFRLVDMLALLLRYGIKKLVESELESAILSEVVGEVKDGIEKIMEESPSLARKRERLKKTVQMLKESKEVIAKIMDEIKMNPVME